MRFALLSLVAATSVSAAALTPRDAPALPQAAFSGMAHKLVPFEDAVAGKDLIGLQFNKTRVSMADLLAQGAATPQTADSASCKASPGMRFEWRQYSQSDRVAWVAAIRCLMNKPASGNFQPARNRYEDFVRMHQDYTPNVHNNPKFHIWHRYFVWTFEQVLRAECGFNRAMPWWDETLDAGNFAKNDMFSQPYFGNLLPAKDSSGAGWCINSGAFGGITLHIGPGGGFQDHCMTRAVNEQLTAQCNSGYINQCTQQRGSYAEYDSCMQYGPHAYGHNGIGAVMSDVQSAVGDPIFWMHHLFVDHTFRIWQNGDPARVQTINGNDVNGNALTMDTMVSVGNIRPNVRVRDIMDTLSGTVIAGVPFCYRYNY